MFMKNFHLLLIFWVLLICSCAEKKQNNNHKLVGAYYFGAGYFTLVPDNIKRDISEMKKMGTDVICITATEGDITDNKSNIQFIIKTIHANGMKVFIVPSNLAAITAGQPLEPSIFPYHHLNTWVINKDSTKKIRRLSGAVCSFYYPEVKQYFKDIVKQIMDTFKVDGIVWDEPKSTYWQDFSLLALENNKDGDFVKYMQDYAAFFSEINKYIKSINPNIIIVQFDEACRNDTVVNESAKIKNIDYFGTDGCPYFTAESPYKGNRATKVLPVFGERYFKAARNNNHKTFALIENQYLTLEEVKSMEKNIDYISSMDVDFLVYYYYGFYDGNSDYKMQVVNKIIEKFRK